MKLNAEKAERLKECRAENFYLCKICTEQFMNE